MLDDLIFYSSLILNITLACYYKRNDGLLQKKNYGAGLGLMIACLICRRQVIPLVFMVFGNVVIIKCSDVRYIHQMTLFWTWLHLLYTHINHVNETYIIWLNQTVALRIVGLAFEIHMADKANNAITEGIKLIIGDSDQKFTEPSVHVIVSYTFFFIGIQKGPYFKWKIYNDHLSGSFGDLGDCRTITEQKLKKMLLCLLGFIVLRARYSPLIYDKKVFYDHYDMDARFIYNVPLLTQFFLKHQIIMLLATSACTEAGFGVYPAECNALPGHGPSTRLSLLKLAATPEKALDMEYNFAMLKCFDNDGLLIGPRMRDTMRSWNISTRYWFWAYLYKNLLDADKHVRDACSYLAWTLYVGPSLQQILISATLWVYVHLESEYSHFYKTSSPSMKVPWDIGFSIMRMFCLIYLTPCFVAREAAVVLMYYNSMFWIYHVILIVMIVGAIIINMNRIRGANSL